MRREAQGRLSQAGALAAASTAAATILCCLPFAVGLLGAGVAAFGSRLAPLRPYLSAASLALLGYAFYHAYRPHEVSCADGSCGGTTRSRTRRITVWLVAVVVALLLTAPWWASWAIYWTL